VPPETPWIGGHFGCSAYGYNQLMKNFGYFPVYVEKLGVNMFFVQLDYLAKLFKLEKTDQLLSLLKAYIPFKSIADPYVNVLIHNSNFDDVVQNNHFCKIEDYGLVKECCKGLRTTPYDCKPPSAFVKPKS